MIDGAVIDRYRKVRRMAADTSTTDGERAAASKIAKRLEKKHEGLKGAASRAEHRESVDEKLKQNGFTGGVKFDPKAAKDFVEQMKAQAGGGEDAGAAESIFWKAMDWAANTITNQASQEEAAPSRKPKRKNPKRSGGLTGELEDEVDAECGFAEDEDGVECVELNLVIPAETWEKVCRGKGAAYIFTKFLDGLLDDD